MSFDLEDFFATLEERNRTEEELRELTAQITKIHGEVNRPFTGFLRSCRKKIKAFNAEYRQRRVEEANAEYQDGYETPRSTRTNERKIRFSSIVTGTLIKQEGNTPPLDHGEEQVAPERQGAPPPQDQPAGEEQAEPTDDATERTREGMEELELNANSGEEDPQDTEAGCPSLGVPLSDQSERQLQRGSIRRTAQRALDQMTHQYQDVLLVQLENESQAWSEEGECVENVDTVKRSETLQQRVRKMKRKMDNEQVCFEMLARTHKRQRSFLDMDDD